MEQMENTTETHGRWQSHGRHRPSRRGPGVAGRQRETARAGGGRDTLFHGDETRVTGVILAVFKFRGVTYAHAVLLPSSPSVSRTVPS